MPVEKYDIRAEFMSGKFHDFQVNAESLQEARQKAQARIREDGRANSNSKFEWRGQVVFVDHEPTIG